MYKLVKVDAELNGGVRDHVLIAEFWLIFVLQVIETICLSD